MARDHPSGPGTALTSGTTMIRYEIRNARCEDLPELLPLWLDLYKVETESGMAYALRSDAADIWMRETERKLGSKTYILLVAVDAAEGLVGFHSLQLRKRSAIYAEAWVGSVVEIYVHPAYRGNRLARLMSERGLQLLAERGMRQAEVQTVPGNLASQAFWKSMGWTCDLIQYRKDVEPGS